MNGDDTPLEDVSNQGSSNVSTSAKKNWGKLKTAVTFSERMHEIVAPPPSLTGSSSTNVHPSMERMATRNKLNHTPVFSNVRLATSECDRLKSTSSSSTGEKNEARSFILYPWNKYNKLWWSITSAAAVATVLNEPFGIAFTPVGDVSAPTSIIEYCLLSVFLVDILVQLNTAY